MKLLGLLTSLVMLAGCTGAPSEPVSVPPATEVVQTGALESAALTPAEIDAQVACTLGFPDDSVGQAIFLTALCANELLTAEQRSCAQDTADALRDLPAPDVPGFEDGPQFTISNPEFGLFVPESLVEIVASVDGVDRVSQELISIEPIIIDDTGEFLRSYSPGPPIIASSWSPLLGSFADSSADGPAAGEFALSEQLADLTGVSEGARYTVVTEDGEETFGFAGSFVTANPDALVFALGMDDAMRVLAGGAGYSTIGVWLAQPDDSVAIAALEQIAAGGDDLVLVEPALDLQEQMDSMAALLRDSLSFVMCLPEVARVSLIGRLVDGDVDLAVTDCLLDTFARDPTIRMFDSTEC